GQDCRVGMSGCFQCLTNDSDLTVHHARRGDHMNTGFGLGNGHASIDGVCCIVIDDTVIVEHTAMAVVSEFVQTGICHNDHVVANFGYNLCDSYVEDALGIDGGAALCIQVCWHAE